jgi:hypothetical protein
MADTTFRADLRDGIYGLLSEYHTANPGDLNVVYRTAPMNYGSRPFAFIRRVTEVIPAIGGRQVWNRNLTVQVAFVWAMTDDGEMADVRDDIVDGFLDYAVRHPHAASSNTLTEPRGTDDVELSFDGAYYPATVVSFIGASQEGRGP